MNLEKELRLFAININYNVGEYYLTQFPGYRSNGYMYPRSSFFSEFGEITVRRFLEDHMEEFYKELENDPTLQKIDDIIYENTVAHLIEKSNWRVQGHASFYETCAKIIILGIFAMEDGCLPGDKITEAIIRFSGEAYSFCILDSSYDQARKSGQEIIYTLFKLLGHDLSSFVLPIEKDVVWAETKLPKTVLEFISNTAPGTLDVLQSDPGLRTMDCEKFDILVMRILQDFIYGRIPMSRNYKENILILAVSVAFISFYSVTVSFNEGIQKGFDQIVELMLLEKKNLYISLIVNLNLKNAKY